MQFWVLLAVCCVGLSQAKLEDDFDYGGTHLIPTPVFIAISAELRGIYLDARRLVGFDSGFYYRWAIRACLHCFVCEFVVIFAGVYTKWRSSRSISFSANSLRGCHRRFDMVQCKILFLFFR